MKEIEKYLKQKIKKNEKCILALSGGPDSMCLLNLLVKINANVICVHINHNTRKKCEQEYQFVKKYLQTKNIPLEYYKIEKYRKGKFSEAEARNIRYEKLKEIADKYQAKYILTAHHGDDLTETILMRILRGSTLERYAGFKKETTFKNHILLRPLIHKKKKEIYAYLKENQIPYVEDESNASDEYIRNRIRHHIIPLLEQENPKYVEKFLKFSETLIEKNTIISEEIIKIRTRIEKEKKIDISKFLELSPLMQKTYIESYLKEIYQEKIEKISSKHLLLFLKYINTSQMSLKINFPDHYILNKEKNLIWLEKEDTFNSYKIKCSEKNILPNGDLVVKIDHYEEKSNNEIHLNSKEVCLPLYLTTRKNGMKIAVKNLNGHQKVNDILINCKIKKGKKDQIPILIDSNGVILWVLGLKKSKYDLEKGENYDIIYKYIKRKEK